MRGRPNYDPYAVSIYGSVDALGAISNSVLMLISITVDLLALWTPIMQRTHPVVAIWMNSGASSHCVSPLLEEKTIHL